MRGARVTFCLLLAGAMAFACGSSGDGPSGATTDAGGQTPDTGPPPDEDAGTIILPADAGAGVDAADAGHAQELLTAAARDPQGATLSTFSQVLANFVPDERNRQDRLRYLLDVLANDGYLVEQERRYLFRFPLLREYWLRRVAPPPAEEAA